MVATAYPNFRDASCCKVDVVNGGAGVFLAGFVSKFLIEKVDPTHFFKKSTASFSLENDFDNSALKTFFPGKSNNATAL